MERRGDSLRLHLRHETKIKALSRSMVQVRSIRNAVFQEVALTL